jgi:hypothetical protein
VLTVVDSDDITMVPSAVDHNSLTTMSSGDNLPPVIMPTMPMFLTVFHEIRMIVPSPRVDMLMNVHVIVSTVPFAIVVISVSVLVDHFDDIMVVRMSSVDMFMYGKSIVFLMPILSMSVVIINDLNDITFVIMRMSRVEILVNVFMDAIIFIMMVVVMIVIFMVVRVWRSGVDINQITVLNTAHKPYVSANTGPTYRVMVIISSHVHIHQLVQYDQPSMEGTRACRLHHVLAHSSKAHDDRASPSNSSWSFHPPSSPSRPYQPMPLCSC